MTNSKTIIQEQDLLVANDIFNKINEEVGKYVIGYKHIIDRIILSVLAQGHILLEGHPGTAKTLLVKTMALTFGMGFNRIQFTPDLLPIDILGTNIYKPQDHNFTFFKGPIFTNFLLADEINRASPKTQSALLEAMQEYQVTIEGKTYKINEPFILIATQNPLESQGVFPLPEAQIDRFLIKLIIDLPSEENEVSILNRSTFKDASPVKVIDKKTILWLQDLVNTVYVSQNVKKFIVKLIRNIRDHESVLIGPSPRSTYGLLQASKSKALIHGRNFVIIDDVYDLLFDVASHRIILKPEAEFEGFTAIRIIDEILITTEI